MMLRLGASHLFIDIEIVVDIVIESFDYATV